jgi:hypothetical protein
MAKGFGRLSHGAFLDSIFKTVNPLYVSLHDADPGDDGQSGNEPSGGNYARKSTVPADWNAATVATPSVSDNANAITFAAATADWLAGANLTHAGLWDHATSTLEANYIGRIELTTPKPILNTEQAEFAINAFQMSITQTP